MASAFGAPDPASGNIESLPHAKVGGAAHAIRWLQCLHVDKREDVGSQLRIAYEDISGPFFSSFFSGQAFQSGLFVREFSHFASTLYAEAKP